MLAVRLLPLQTRRVFFFFDCVTCVLGQDARLITQPGIYDQGRSGGAKSVHGGISDLISHKCNTSFLFLLGFFFTGFRSLIS